MKEARADRIKLSRVVRDIFLEATGEELREGFIAAGEDFARLAEQGRKTVNRALEESDQKTCVRELHQGLGVLLRMLCRREKLSIQDLANRARVDVTELQKIETDPEVDLSPRTIYQLEQFFKLKPRSLVILSGAVSVDNQLRKETMQFAAHANKMMELNREELVLLRNFVAALGRYTDR